jgi:hypothetical protein
MLNVLLVFGPVAQQPLTNRLNFNLKTENEDDTFPMDDHFREILSKRIETMERS